MADEPRVIRHLDVYEVSFIDHPPTGGCVVLSPEQPHCPHCGAGYVSIGEPTTAVAPGTRES